MYELCSLDYDDEYTLHHEFSRLITDADDNSVNQVIDYVSQRRNPFKTGTNVTIENIATGTKVEKTTSDFLINCIDIGEVAYRDFHKSRLELKTSGLFDTIPKSRQIKEIATQTAKYDLKKETVAFIRNVDHARVRNYDIDILLQYELTSTFFYLTKDSNLRKPNTSELGHEIRKCMSRIAHQ